jgi:DNA-directed RNA polymerase subunit RPC12/RpoP
MMRGKVVLVPFPFDDLVATKVRPAVCLTDPRAPYCNKLILSKNRSETMKTVTLRLPNYLAETLPVEESSLCEILELGLKQFRIEGAIITGYYKFNMHLH